MEKMGKLFRALADETRLRIYLLLLKGELCVCELVDILNMEQSRISHSLRILREASLVDDRREGKWIIYSVNLKMSKNKIIQGLRDELKLLTVDLKNFVRCKQERIRGKCKIE